MFGVLCVQTVVVLWFVMYDCHVSKFLLDDVVEELESRFVQLWVDERRDDDETRMAEGLQKIDEIHNVCLDREVRVISAAVHDDVLEIPDLWCSCHES